MLPISKWGFPTRLRRQREFTEELYPDLGIHTGIAPNKLPVGYSPRNQNLVPRKDGEVNLREGLQSSTTYAQGEPVLGSVALHDIFGNPAAAAMSAGTFSYIFKTSGAWSKLSYVPGSVVSTAVTGAPSGTSNDYWRAVQIYEPSSDSMICVASNNTNWLKFFYIHSSTSLFSDFTWTDSLLSSKMAKGVESFDDRLVFFNVTDATNKQFPTRVLFSARGNPLSYSIAAGAGIIDIMDMVGYGTAAIRYKDLLILFSDHEVWRGVPTRDANAFQFNRITDKFGCERPRTIATTAYGVVFLGRDYEVYMTDGTSITALGPISGTGLSRIQKLLKEEMTNPERTWAVFNQNLNRYELYYATSSSVDGFPNAALFYSFEDQTWWRQSFNKSLSDGVDTEDVQTLQNITWDSLSVTWDSYALPWDSAQTSFGDLRVNVFDSTGAFFRFNSEVTVDAGGDAIDARWRSPGLNQRGTVARADLTELWLEGTGASNSSVSIFLSDDLGKTFDSGRAVSVLSSNPDTFAPLWMNAKNPMFELRSNDGQTPSFTRFKAVLRESGKF